MSHAPVLDRCPAVLRPHEAADGLMVRIRLPGGRIAAPALAALGELAGTFGNPNVYLTSRCGVQLRGLPSPLPRGLSAAVAELGLLPSRTHERSRTIIGSPLTGIEGGVVDTSSLITELDRSIQATPELADLSGRFPFVLDDGRHDVIGQPFDLAYVTETPTSGWVLVGDRAHGRPVSRAAAAATLTELARGFVAARPDAGVWHVCDLPAWRDSVTEELDAIPVSIDEQPLGAVGDAASVLVPLAALSPQQLSAVARAAVGGELRLTPERGLVIPGAAPAVDELMAVGLIAGRSSAWSRITACVGAPFCGRTDVDTRSTARQLVDRGLITGRTHLSGCERRCGAPRRDHLDLVGPVEFR